MDFKHEDVLRSIEVESTWTKSGFVCASCRYRDVDHSCETPAGRVCVSCGEKFLREANAAINVEKWSISKFQEALSPTGRLRWRLLVLARCDEVIRKFTAEKDLNQFLALLVDNLGYLDSHPLARIVRQQALNTCIRVGVVILPVLFEKAQSNPWEFYVNIVVAAATIAPQDAAVHKLLSAAARHANASVREKVIFVLSATPAAFAISVLTPMTNDQNFHVRTLARQKVVEMRKYLVATPPPPRKKEPRAVNSQRPVSHKNDPILMTVQQSYQKEDLLRFYQKFLVKIVPPGKLGKSNDATTATRLRIADLALAMKLVVESKDLFLALLELLPSEARLVTTTMIWLRGTLNVADHDKNANSKILQIEGGREAQINSAFLFCAHQVSYEFRSVTHLLLIPDRLRKILQQYLPMPDFATIKPLPTQPKSEHVFIADDAVPGQVYNLHRYLATGNIQFSRIGTKILAASAKEIRSHFKLPEFFTGAGKELDDLRLHILVSVLLRYSQHEKDPLKFFQKVITDFLSGEPAQDYSLSELVTHLKGTRQVDYSLKNELMFRKSIQQVVQSLPVGEWIDFRNLEMHFLCREYFDQVIPFNIAFNYLSFTMRTLTGPDRGRSNRHIVSSENYQLAVLEPFMKSALFVVGALGVLDLAFDLPGKQTPTGEFLTFYDGLIAIRLTERGAFAVGKNPQYKLEIERHQVKVTLDENHLILYLEGEDPVKSMLLAKIGDRLTSTCFKVTFQSFLKGCNSQADIENKLNLFRTEVSKNPPENWKTFLKSVEKKMNPLKAEPAFAVFKIDPSRELVELITRDAVLRDCIIKAEDFRILIDLNNLKKVKKRLEEFGYFIDTW